MRVAVRELEALPTDLYRGEGVARAAAANEFAEVKCYRLTFRVREVGRDLVIALEVSKVLEIVQPVRVQVHAGELVEVVALVALDVAIPVLCSSARCSGASQELGVVGLVVVRCLVL